MAGIIGMTAIPFTTVQSKTMADDTLRLTIDIEPQHADEAFRLFGKRGIPGAAARLVMEHEKPKADIGIPSSEEKQEDKPKGGPLSQLAGQWCYSPAFWEFLHTQRGTCEIEHEDECAMVLRDICKVESRAEIDSNPQAKAIFMELRQEYMNWGAA